MWRLAIKDPHLMRLGEYLQHLEGEQEVARLLEEDDIDMEELERAFLAEPWKEGLSIVRVVDPTGFTKPFIEVANIKAKDHKNCLLRLENMTTKNIRSEKYIFHVTKKPFSPPN